MSAALKIVKNGRVQKLLVDGFELPFVTAFNYETDASSSPYGELHVSMLVELVDEPDGEGECESA